MGDLVLAIDSSTTACKAIAWDASGRVVAEGRAPIALDNPSPDAWQQDARAWWDALVTACRAVTRELEPTRLGALCITHQRETFVLTDPAGEPLHPALVWMDHRAGAEVQEAVAALGADYLHETSGKPPCTTPSLYKLLFLLSREPRLRSPSTRVLDVHAFLVGRLTGRFVTSHASADPMGLLDMAAGSWAPSLLALAGLEAHQVPELVPPGDVIGWVSTAAALATGLPAGLTVVAGAGDGQCAGLGAGITAPGRAYLNLGTAIVSGVLSSSYRTDRAFRTLYGAVPGTYFMETDLHGGTFVVSWLAERFVGQELAVLAREAASLGPGADGLVVVPYWAGAMNPLWDDMASGVVVGWRGDHRPPHLYRAILEGIALEQRWHTEGVEAVTGPIEELVVMGGGSQSELWCQILADVLGKRIVRATSPEATALGAGVLAAARGGLHESLEASCAAMTGGGGVAFVPGDDRAFYDRLYREVYLGLYGDLQDRMQRLWRLRTTAR